ncbi:MAG: AAA family ATPase, partial [Planctomycetaceae bacterium]|nr:AAA family ATPase [Planctomycetaceae bacterium]
MILNELRIDQFGSLHETTLGPLSRRITVFWGPNGCGKTTAVEFLRSMMFGMNRIRSPFSRSHMTEGGALEVSDPSSATTFGEPHSHFRLTRTRRSDSTESQSLLNLQSGASESFAQIRLLPDWVTVEVCREIFTVGYEEAARFDLLTRLCLEKTVLSGADDPEICSAETALSRILRERDGHGLQDGIPNRIVALRTQRRELLNQLEQLRRPDTDLPERIRRTSHEADELVAELGRIDARLADMDKEIVRTEQQLAELRRRNVLPLSVEDLQARIRTVAARMERWQQIRKLITAEQQTQPTGTRLHATEDLTSVRALMSRLEDRAVALQQLTEPQTTLSTQQAAEQTRCLHQLRDEIAALCSYLRHHESAVLQFDQRVEQSIIQNGLASVSQMETLLQDELAGLQRELARATSVLEHKAI